MKSRLSLIRKGKYVLLLGIALTTMTCANAQADDDTPPSTSEGETDVPFDGGISLLVAAGVAYGLKQWNSSRKQNDHYEHEPTL